jgi:hypothetical protein
VTLNRRRPLNEMDMSFAQSSSQLNSKLTDIRMEVALKTKKTGRAWKAAKAELPVAVRNSDITHM